MSEYHVQKVATADCHVCQKVKDAAPRTVVLSCPARKSLLRYLEPLSSVCHVPKRISYAMNAFLLPKHTLNCPKTFKR